MDFGMCSGVGYGSNAPGILRGDCSVGLHLYKVPRVVKFIKTKSRMLVARAPGDDKGQLFNRRVVSVWEDKEVLEMNGGDCCTIM